MPRGIYKHKKGYRLSKEHREAISKSLMNHPNWGGGRYSVYGEGICHGCGIRPYIYKSYKCKECSNELTKKIYHQNPQKIITYNRRIKDELQKIVYQAYGNKCECCGEVEPLFFNIDHINNDGKKDRIRPSGKARDSLSVLKLIIRENFPKRLRILCYNCNMGRERNNGICPHNKLLKDSTPK